MTETTDQASSTHIEEYRRRSAVVWPDMTRAHEASGRSSSPVVLRRDYLVTGHSDPSEPMRLVRATVDSSLVGKRWQTILRGVSVDGTRPPIVLEKVSYLDGGDPDASAGSGR